MAADPLGKTSASIAQFALRELKQLSRDLHTNGMKIKAQEDLVGALVLAARRAAIADVKAYVEAYWVRESAIAEGLGGAASADDST